MLVILILAIAAACIPLIRQEAAQRPVLPVYANAEASQSTVDAAPESIPEFSGEDYIVLNENRPNFTVYDLENISGEQFCELDELGRCGTAVAMLTRSMMPVKERESIGDVRPSGWQYAKYPGLVEDDYLYHRCHLIAYALTGQNANPLNLITGTRYMNMVSMFEFEQQVMQYLDDSWGHVLYRVSPLFKGRELVARGVEIEAYSVEDEGREICFHVFVYNQQPGIVIDYRTGDSRPE